MPWQEYKQLLFTSKIQPSVRCDIVIIIIINIIIIIISLALPPVASLSDPAPTGGEKMPS